MFRTPLKTKMPKLIIRTNGLLCGYRSIIGADCEWLCMQYLDDYKYGIGGERIKAPKLSKDHSYKIGEERQDKEGNKWVFDGKYWNPQFRLRICTCNLYKTVLETPQESSSAPRRCQQCLEEGGD